MGVTGRASVWEREVHDRLVAHVEVEDRMLEEYRQFAEASDSEAIRYLVALILEDEARHHRLFKELDQAFPSAQELPADEPRVPIPDRESHPDEMLELTERFLRLERQDAGDLRRLRRKLRPLRRRSLAPLLVELMELDTHKHIRTLRFVRDRLSAQP